MPNRELMQPYQVKDSKQGLLAYQRRQHFHSFEDALVVESLKLSEPLLACTGQLIHEPVQPSQVRGLMHNHLH